MARTVQRRQDVQLRTWCSSRAVSSLPPAKHSSIFQRTPATRTSSVTGTGRGAGAREKAYSPSLIRRRISSQFAPCWALLLVSLLLVSLLLVSLLLVSLLLVSLLVRAGSVTSIRAQSYRRGPLAPGPAEIRCQAELGSRTARSIARRGPMPVVNRWDLATASTNPSACEARALRRAGSAP